VFRGDVTAPERDLLIQQGLDAADAILHANPHEPEALIVKGLLLRLRAAAEPDPLRRDALVREAEALAERAMAEQKKKLAGI
jgi:hypothetical protein